MVSIRQVSHACMPHSTLPGSTEVLQSILSAWVILIPDQGLPSPLLREVRGPTHLINAFGENSDIRDMFAGIAI